MAYLAVRGCGAINGVSRLHGEVSRRIFSPCFPAGRPNEVPIGHVTNGVHTPSWDGPAADELWTSCLRQGPLAGIAGDGRATRIRGAADSAIWRVPNAPRAIARSSTPASGCHRSSRHRARTPEEIEGAKQLFNPDALTLGFARRFATYKRPNLLLQDPERLVRLLTNPQRPVQLILAGKAHPADIPGQALIRDWVQFVRRHDVRPHAIFLADYDMLMTEHLVAGRGCLDQHSPAAVGSLRHQRHESAGQRRTELLGARWLVG